MTFRELAAFVALVCFAIATVLAAGWFGAHGNAAAWCYGGLFALTLALAPRHLP